MKNRDRVKQVHVVWTDEDNTTFVDKYIMDYQTAVVSEKVGRDNNHRVFHVEICGAVLDNYVEIVS